MLAPANLKSPTSLTAGLKFIPQTSLSVPASSSGIIDWNRPSEKLAEIMLVYLSLGGMFFNIIT